jgi:peptide/nickel transport system ATP-binding protein
MTRPVLSVRDLEVRRAGRCVLGPLSLELRRGAALGLIGASGSGKSTLLRALAGLLPVSAAELAGPAGSLLGVRGEQRRRRQRRLALVFQEPRASLNPSRTIGSVLGEILRHAAADDTGDAGAPSAATLLARVGLDPALADRRPRSLSLGQCQRVQVARALAQAPDVLLLDEVTSALDTVASGALRDLFRSLRAAGTALVVASHDLGLVESLCDDLMVLEAGRVVDGGSAAECLANSTVAATRRLAAARLPLTPALARDRLRVPAGSP